MTKTLSDLLADSPTYLTCHYSRNGALGFKGSKESIERAHNLFVNYDRMSRLRWVSGDLAYIAISPARIRAAIKTYLYVNLLHSKEVPSYSEWDEEAGVFTLHQDIENAERLSSEGADEFIANLQTASFIPSNDSTAVDHEYRTVSR
jgi:hypothetical protein